MYAQKQTFWRSNVSAKYQGAYGLEGHPRSPIRYHSFATKLFSALSPQCAIFPPFALFLTAGNELVEEVFVKEDGEGGRGRGGKIL